jgi:tRNA-splicing ligase RtcB
LQLHRHCCHYRQHQQHTTTNLPSLPRSFSANDQVKDPQARDVADQQLRAQFLEPSHPPYLEGAEASAYYYDMIFAQCYAARSRWIMARLAAEAAGADAVSRDAAIETTHNYVDFGDGVWRKGAVRAGAGELLAVALNMRDGLLLVRGKGNPEWNCSAPHGAGRLAPRGEAKRMTTMREFVAAMEGVYSDCVVPETLDESPAMYKDHAVVMERSADTCEIVAHLKPVLNIKGF